MGVTPAGRSLTPRAPEKGVFPLDHFGECKEAMAAYMACLKEASYATEGCRHLSKRYLECRMSRGLMAEEDLSKLGFKGGEAAQKEAAQQQAAKAAEDKRATEKAGFVAGLRPIAVAEATAQARKSS